MDNLILSEEYNLKYSQMDCNLALKPYALLNFLQDIASNSAEQLGFGYSYMYPKNLAWFLIKYRMEFIDYPVGIYNLTIKTKPRGYNKLFAYRDFEIYNNDKLLGKISSVWSIIDTNTHSLTLIQNVIQNPNMPQYQKQENDLTFSKIPTLTKVDNELGFHVRYNDLDVNKHANNGNYIIWAFETLGSEFLMNHKIKNMDLMFKKEAKYNEKLISQVQINENTTIHCLKNKENEDLFQLQCEWSKI